MITKKIVAYLDLLAKQNPGATIADARQAIVSGQWHNPKGSDEEWITVARSRIIMVLEDNPNGMSMDKLRRATGGWSTSVAQAADQLYHEGVVDKRVIGGRHKIFLTEAQ